MLVAMASWLTISSRDRGVNTRWRSSASISASWIGRYEAKLEMHSKARPKCGSTSRSPTRRAAWIRCRACAVSPSVSITAPMAASDSAGRPRIRRSPAAGCGGALPPAAR